MGTDIKHPVPDRVKPSFVIFVIRTLALSPECQSARMSKITNVGLTRSDATTTVGVKGLTSLLAPAVTCECCWVCLASLGSTYQLCPLVFLPSLGLSVAKIVPV